MVGGGDGKWVDVSMRGMAVFDRRTCHPDERIAVELLELFPAHILDIDKVNLETIIHTIPFLVN